MASDTNKLPPPSQKKAGAESARWQTVVLLYWSHQIKPCWRRVRLRRRQICEPCWLPATVWQHHSWRPQPISPMRTDGLISPSLPGCLWSPRHCVDGLCCSRVIAGVTWANSAGSEHLSIFLSQAIIAWFSSVLKCKCGELCGNKSLSGFLGTSVMVSQQERRYRWEWEWCMWLNPEYRRFAIDSSHFKHLNYWCANSNCESEEQINPSEWQRWGHGGK